MHRFLLIEDSAADSDLFKDSVKRLNDAAEEDLYYLDVASTASEAEEKISGSFDGIIVDIKLDDCISGIDIVNEIQGRFRVPVAIFSATPYEHEQDEIPIPLYKKGADSHEKIIQDFCSTLETGIFNVLGGTGEIESYLLQIFWKNLYPQLDIWKSKRANGEETEKILLRYAISHILELMDQEVPTCVTEEMYICPPMVEGYLTGSVIQNRKTQGYRIVLSPPCDLAIRDGKTNTDCILTCEIEPYDAVNSTAIKSCTKAEAVKKVITKKINNTSNLYHHWLPRNSLFCGGYINFRKIETYSLDDLRDQFYPPILKIQNEFAKSILSRFSSYYARQGQPDFKFNDEVEKIIISLPRNEVTPKSK